MGDTRIITLRKNGRTSDSTRTLQVHGTITNVDDFMALVKQNFPELKLHHKAKLYSHEGNELTGDSVVLLKDKDVVYFDTKGNPFNKNNILSQYELIEELGRGGFGKVHKARHVETGEFVSIKFIDITDFRSFLPLPLVYHASRADSIYKEAQVLMKLNHPNIVKLYNMLTCENQVVLIMEYVSGGSLYKYIKERSKDGYGLREYEARNIFRQLADTVSYCHDCFIIHRDLKPENILLGDADGKRVKIIDFGIAGSNYKESDCTRVGSLQILPPEALRDRQVSAYPATDVWALGVVLYFLLYGKLPFNGSNEKALIENIINKEPEFPADKVVSEHCINLLTQMLNKDCISRISMEELLKHPWLSIPEEEIKEASEENKKMWDVKADKEQKQQAKIKENKMRNSIQAQVKELEKQNKANPKTTRRTSKKTVDKKVTLDTPRPVVRKSSAILKPSNFHK